MAIVMERLIKCIEEQRDRNLSGKDIPWASQGSGILQPHLRNSQCPVSFLVLVALLLSCHGERSPI